MERKAAKLGDAKLDPDTRTLLETISKKVIAKIEATVRAVTDSNGKYPYKNYKLGDFYKRCSNGTLINGDPN